MNSCCVFGHSSVNEIIFWTLLCAICTLLGFKTVVIPCLLFYRSRFVVLLALVSSAYEHCIYSLSIPVICTHILCCLIHKWRSMCVYPQHVDGCFGIWSGRNPQMINSPAILIPARIIWSANHLKRQVPAPFSGLQAPAGTGANVNTSVGTLHPGYQLLLYQA